MDVRFPDGINQAMSPLMGAIEEIVDEMLPMEATKDSEILRETMAKSQLIVTGDKRFILEARPGRQVVISLRAIELFWFFTYAHAEIYLKTFAGRGNQAIDFDLDDDEYKIPRDILQWVHSFGAVHGHTDYETYFPTPDPNAGIGTVERKALQIARHFIRSVLLHELSHVAYEIFGDTPKKLIEEENKCDLRALAWMQFRKPKTEADYRRTKIGSALALLYVAACGIESKNYDGVTHPLAYNRPITTLGSRYGRREHGVWGFCLTVLALHCGNKDIDVPWDKIGYDEFHDAVMALKAYLDKTVEKPDLPK